MLLFFVSLINLADFNDILCNPDQAAIKCK